MPNAIIFWKGKEDFLQRSYKCLAFNILYTSHSERAVPVSYTWEYLALPHPKLFPVLTSTPKIYSNPSNRFKRKITGVYIGIVYSYERITTLALCARIPSAPSKPKSNSSSYFAWGASLPIQPPWILYMGHLYSNMIVPNLLRPPNSPTCSLPI